MATGGRIRSSERVVRGPAIAAARVRAFAGNRNKRLKQVLRGERLRRPLLQRLARVSLLLRCNFYCCVYIRLAERGGGRSGPRLGRAGRSFFRVVGSVAVGWAGRGLPHLPRAWHSGVATPVARGGPSRPDSRRRSNCNWGLSISPWTQLLRWQPLCWCWSWSCSKLELVASRRRGRRQSFYAPLRIRAARSFVSPYLISRFLNNSARTHCPSSRTLHLSRDSCTPGGLLTHN